MKESEQPLVSILMTSFNREKYISTAIESVIQLNYRNWELIVCDDSSSDSTFTIAMKYSVSDARIRVFKNENNLGDYPNRNRAASYANGKYIKYLDADDYIYKYGIDIMVESLESFPDAALGLSRSQSDFDIYPICLSPSEAYKEHFIGNYLLTNSPAGAIIRLDKFKELGGFSGVRHIGDFELWLKLSGKYPVVKILPGLVHWRRHDAQENAISKKKDHLFLDKYFMNIKFACGPDSPLNEYDKKAAYEKIQKNFLKYLISDTIRNKRLMRNLKLFIKSKANFWMIFK